VFYRARQEAVEPDRALLMASGTGERQKSRRRASEGKSGDYRGLATNEARNTRAGLNPPLAQGPNGPESTDLGRTVRSMRARNPPICGERRRKTACFRAIPAISAK